MKLGTRTDTAEPQDFELTSESLLVVGNDPAERELMTDLALQLAEEGKPFVFLDNDEDAIDDILDHMPKDRQKDVIYCSPSDFPFALNIYDQPAERHELLALTINDAIRTIHKFDHVSTSNITENLIAGTLTLLTVKGTSLLHLDLLLTDAIYRKRITDKLTDPFLIRHWQEFEKRPEKEKRELTRSTLSKLRILGMLPTMRSCIGQLRNRLVFKDKIVLLSLKESKLGSENAALIGAFALTTLYLDAVQGLETAVLIRNTRRFATGLLPALLHCKNVQTIISARNLAELGDQEAPLLTGSEKIVAFRTSHKDASALKSDIPLGDGDTKLHQLHRGRAHVSGIKPVPIKIDSHNFPKTKVRDRIIERCRRRCTAKPDALAKRLARIAKERQPVKRRRKRKKVSTAP